MSKVGLREVFGAYLAIFAGEAIHALAIEGAANRSSLGIGLIALGFLIWLGLVCLMWMGSPIAWVLLVFGTALAILDLWILAPSGDAPPIFASCVYAAELLLLLSPQLRNHCLPRRSVEGSS